jgi:hypothetical protein
MTILKNAVLFIVCSYSFLMGAIVTGYFNLDTLYDTLKFPDTPDENKLIPIEIVCPVPGGIAKRIKSHLAMSEENITLGQGKKGEIVILEYGNTGSSERDYRYFDYNNKKNDWFLVKSIAYSRDISGDGSFTTLVGIKYNDGTERIDGTTIAQNEAEVETAAHRTARLGKSLDSLHRELAALEKSDKLSEIPPSAYDVKMLEELIANVPLTVKTVVAYNDIGFYLAHAKEGLFSSVYLLVKVIEKFPERAVAYLNLADAYWKLEDFKNAKEEYGRYCEIRIKDGKKDKIPDRVFERIKTE